MWALMPNPKTPPAAVNAGKASPRSRGATQNQEPSVTDPLSFTASIDLPDGRHIYVSIE
jgi:hypothetical protein